MARERALRWELAQGAPAHDLANIMRGVTVTPRETRSFSEEIGAEVENARLIRVEEPAGRRTFRFEHELLALPPDFERHCSLAREIHLVFGTALGGDGGVMLAAIRILNEAVERGATVSAHLERYAGSADADLYVLVPGRRTMHPGAKLLLHQGHVGCFGDASQLREAAEALERFEMEHVARMAKRTGQPLDVVRSWYMPAADVVFTAGAALGCRLCDEITEAAP